MNILQMLKQSGLRPTKQRLSIVSLLFSKGNRHVTVEQIHNEVMQNGHKISLATVYNTLNQLTSAGLLNELSFGMNRSYFDTNTSPHQHFYCESDCRLIDIPDGMLEFPHMPSPPDGCTIKSIDVFVRLDDSGNSRQKHRSDIERF